MEDQLVDDLKGFNINDLMSEKGTTFEVNFENMRDNDGDDELPYDTDNVHKYCNPLWLQDEDDYKDGEPFSSLVTKMTDLLPNGGIKKRILREGYGEILPENAMVTIHYNAYTDCCDEPFDSTYLQRKPLVFQLGAGTTLPGIDLAVQSMKLNEKSQFLVHYEYAYGPLGCLDRIPEKATILFEIEVKKFVDSGATVAFSQLSDEEKNNFEHVHLYAHALLSNGKDLFGKQLYHQAIREYNTAVGKLVYCQLQNIKDQEKQETLLIRLHQNLAICNMKINKPKKACTHCNEVYRLSQNRPISEKVYVHHARALMALMEYDRAEWYLKKALKVASENKTISDELVSLNKKREEDKTRQIKLAKAMLPSLADCQGYASDEFRLSIVEACQHLNANPGTGKLHLPIMSEAELDFAKATTKKFGLKIDEEKSNNTVKYVISL